MVSVLVTEPPLGVTDGGLNVQVTPGGNAPQLNVTVELKPFIGETVRVNEADAPALMLALVGLAEML